MASLFSTVAGYYAVPPMMEARGAAPGRRRVLRHAAHVRPGFFDACGLSRAGSGAAAHPAASFFRCW